MDLNHHYFEHQLSLMRAGGAVTRLSRTLHLAAAGVTANRIGNHQLGTGAAAADGWIKGSQNIDGRADRVFEVAA
jgi:hypothetical protein